MNRIDQINKLIEFKKLAKRHKSPKILKMTRLERFKSINGDDSLWISAFQEPWIDRTWLEFQMKHDRKLFAIFYMEKLVNAQLNLYILGSESNQRSKIRKRECILIKSQFSFLQTPKPILALQDLFSTIDKCSYDA